MSQDPFIVPTLVGRHVRLEPLQAMHVDGLRQAAADGELWRQWYTSVPGPDAVGEYVAAALAAQASGALPGGPSGGPSGSGAYGPSGGEYRPTGYGEPAPPSYHDYAQKK